MVRSGGVRARADSETCSPGRAARSGLRATLPTPASTVQHFPGLRRTSASGWWLPGHAPVRDRQRFALRRREPARGCVAGPRHVSGARADRFHVAAAHAAMGACRDERKVAAITEIDDVLTRGVEQAGCFTCRQELLGCRQVEHIGCGVPHTYHRIRKHKKRNMVRYLVILVFGQRTLAGAP